MLHFGKRALKLLVFALLRFHLFKPLDDKTCLVHGLGTLMAVLKRLVVLLLRAGTRLPRSLVVALFFSDGIGCPSVKESEMVLLAQEFLMVVLATQVDMGACRLGELTHGCHRAVKRATRATLAGNPSAHNMAVGELLGIALVSDLGLDEQEIAALTHLACLGTFADEQLYGAQQGRLARARLTRKDREPARRADDRVLNQGEVFDMKLFNHLMCLVSFEGG